jgi:hypothetical protein
MFREKAKAMKVLTTTVQQFLADPWPHITSS